MPELRWILIAFGLVLLIGIYAWGRRTSKKNAPDEMTFRPRPEPVFDGEVRNEPRFEEPVDAHLDEQSEDERTAESQFEPQQTAYERSVIADRDIEETTLEAPASRFDRHRRSPRIEPVFAEETQTAELPAYEPESTVAPKPTTTLQSDAPTLSMSSTPAPRRIERRKIVALRLAAGAQRIPGAQLRAVLESESLQHGKYDVFHRLDDSGASLFSVASMVEPGTFDLEKMAQESYPGITMFAQFPAPVAGMLAFNELVACSRRLHAALGGTLQDERGVPLTVHRVERIRQDIREFEHRPVEPANRSSTPYSPSP